MSAGTSQGVYLSRRSTDFGAEAVCSSTVECALLSITDQLAFAFGVGLLGLIIATALVSLPGALKCCAEERRRTRQERDAFDRFARAVSAIESADPQLAPAAIGTDLVIDQASRNQQSQISSIENAYRETIMSVPHYTEEYAEPMQVNVATELGEDLAIAIFETRQFTPQVKRVLLQKTIASRDRRTELLHVLDEEHSVLRECENALTTIEERVNSLLAVPRYDLTYDELIERYHRIQSWREDCENLVQDRQSHRTIGHAATFDTRLVSDLNEYLYRSLEVTYPVLSDGTRLLTRLDTSLNRLESELIYRG